MASAQFAAPRLRIKKNDKWSFTSRTMPRETPKGVRGTKRVIEIIHGGKTYHAHAVSGDIYLVMDMETGEFVTLDFTEAD